MIRFTDLPPFVRGHYSPVVTAVTWLAPLEVLNCR
jgi:hypothetical protein